MAIFWQRWTAGAASVKRDKSLSCAGQNWSQLAPTDPLQNTAEHISKDGFASVKTFLRKGKKYLRREKRREQQREQQMK